VSEKPRWTIASARQHLTALVAASAREPQKVYRRNKVVAAVVAPTALAAAERRETMAEALAELQRICAEEHYELPLARRTTRPNPMAKRRKR
jgi:hypothetical protein